MTLLAAPAAAQAPVVRDSAGVRIVENPARATAPVVFRLGRTPVLDIGGPQSDPSMELNAQTQQTIVRRSDGSFAVGDRTRVQFFDAAGKRLRITGSDGQGPEEFRNISFVCLSRADTLVVVDQGNRRLAILDRAGAIVRTVRMQQPLLSPGDACLEDGTFLLQSPSTAGPDRPMGLRVTRVGTDGARVNVVGEFTFPPLGSPGAMNIPQVFAAGRRIFVGGEGTSELRIFNPEGRLTEIVRTADRPERITNAQWEEMMRRRLPLSLSVSEAETRLRSIRAEARPETWPAYGRGMVDPGGTLWLEDFRRPGEDAWTAFDSSGRLIGRLQIPVPPDSPMAVRAFVQDGVVIWHHDELGFPHLTLYPIERIATPG
jgi:hypothetical protein